MGFGHRLERLTMPHIIVSRTRPFMPSLNVPGLSLNFLPTDSGTMKSETSFCVQSLSCSVTFLRGVGARRDGWATDGQRIARTQLRGPLWPASRRSALATRPPLWRGSTPLGAHIILFIMMRIIGCISPR